MRLKVPKVTLKAVEHFIFTAHQGDTPVSWRLMFVTGGYLFREGFLKEMTLELNLKE